jgi:hypothetical protein
MSNHEDECSDLEKELAEEEIQKHKDDERKAVIQDCTKKKMQKYEQDHPCESCMARVDLPDYKPPSKGETVDAAFQEHLNAIAETVQQHLEKCRKKVKGKARLKKLLPENECLCLLILQLAAMWGYSYQELGKILGKREDAVAAMARRCRQKVAPYFEECRSLVARKPTEK